MGAKRSARKSKQRNENNIVAINNFLPQKKKEVKILPRNINQETYVLKLLDPKKDIVFGIGPAGTGKTLLAVQTAVKQFKEGAVDKIVVTRPAVSADEDLGFLPGTMEQKMAPWTRPIFDVLKEYFTATDLEGIVADEMQNATQNQMKMLLTRLGTGSKMAVTGDLAQADRLADNGLIDFCRHVENKGTTDRLTVVEFQRGDIERHEAVKEVLEIYGDVY